jgi:hypothetical protein
MTDVDVAVNIKHQMAFETLKGRRVVALGDHSVYSAIMPLNEQSGVLKSSPSEQILF